MAAPFTATNLTNAAKVSHTVQSTLSTTKPKQKKSTDEIKNVASWICIGCFIGYSFNYLYNKYYNNYTIPMHYPRDNFKIKSTKEKQKEKQMMLKKIKTQLFKYKHSSKRNLLFIPNESQNGYKQIKQFMDNLNINKLLLIPFGHDNWTENAKYIEMKMWEIGKKSVSIHNKQNMKKSIEECDGIIISNDSNVYKLLYYLYYYNLMSILRKVINNNGRMFVAIGSGINIASLTLQTSFDIPIIMPPTIKSLSIIPFQLMSINSRKCDNYDKDLRLFLKENKDHNINVLLLCENCFLVVQNNKIQLKGNGDGCVLYKDYESEKETIMVGGLLTSLLFNLNK